MRACACVRLLPFLIASLSQSRLNTAENVAPGLQCTILGELAGTTRLDLARPAAAESCHALRAGVQVDWLGRGGVIWGLFKMIY